LVRDNSFVFKNLEFIKTKYRILQKLPRGTSLVSLVGAIGIEPTCDQLLFLLLIRERRYTPVKCGYYFIVNDQIILKENPP